MRRGAWTIVGALCLSLGCGDGGPPDDGPLTWEKQWEPFQLAAGEEQSSDCLSWTLENDQPIYVNAVQMDAGFGWHHSNWYWVPEAYFPGEDGRWNCRDRNFDQLEAGTRGGVLFAQSTQATTEIQKFPDGVAVRLPPRVRVIGQVHLLNASGESLDTQMKLTLHAQRESDVHTRLSPMSLEFLPLAIPPARRSRFYADCDIGAAHQQVVGRPIDFSVYYVLPHYHELGEGMTVEAMGGAASGNMIFRSTSPIGEPMGGPIDPIFDMTGASDMRFSCTFNNPTDKTIGWGIGDQEMCIFLAFTDSEYKWAGGVITGSAEHVGDDPDGVAEYTGTCNLIGVPQD